LSLRIFAKANQPFPLFQSGFESGSFSTANDTSPSIIGSAQWINQPQWYKIVLFRRFKNPKSGSRCNARGLTTLRLESF